jgi:hypothetical protein
MQVTNVELPRSWISLTRLERRSDVPCADSVEYLASQIELGADMARYLSQHSLACLTRQGAEALARRMQAGGSTHALRVLVNMLEGKIIAEFQAESREALESWLSTEKMHYDWIVRIEWELRDGKLESV